MGIQGPVSREDTGPCSAPCLFRLSGGLGLFSLSLLDGLVLFLLLGGRRGKDGVTGTDLGAELAAYALFIVDNRHAVYYMDGVLFALLLDRKSTRLNSSHP